MEWKEVRLGDILNFRRGHDLPHSAMKPGNIPVAGSNGVIGYHDTATPIKPILTIGRSGNVGKPYFYEEAWAHNTTLYVDDFKGNDPKFLYYLCQTMPFANFGGGSAVPTLNRNHIHPLETKIPVKVEDQRRIASILSSLDRKIELNNKINADLEEMAQAIFKNWFVDFEPFKDGKFVDSELGMIPEGWKVGCLGDITSNKSAKVKERTDVKVLSPVTTGELVLSEEYFSKQVFSSSIAKYKIVNIGDFAYNPARVNIGSLGRNEFEFDGCVSPVYVVFSVIDGYENYFDLFRKTDFFKDKVASLAIGGVRQSLSYDDLSSIETIIPNINIVEKFNNLYNQMKKTIKANKQESSCILQKYGIRNPPASPSSATPFSLASCQANWKSRNSNLGGTERKRKDL